MLALSALARFGDLRFMVAAIVLVGSFTGVSAQDAESRLKLHAKPSPISDQATVADWPRFLGPADNASSTETPLLREWGDAGPRLLWTLAKGEGYASPIVGAGRLLLFHRMDGEERVECRSPIDGSLVWETTYPVEYRDRYGYQNGPRSSPVIDGDFVYVFGVTSQLRCLDLATGKVRWHRDLTADFAPIRESFFGAGSSPLVVGDQLVVMIGAEGGPCVVGFDKTTGETLWGAEDEWGASYASPILSHSGEQILVMAGGQSDPPHGGLLSLEVGTGKILGRFDWRSEVVESVNAATPVALPGNRVFITQCYGDGGAMLQIAEDGSLSELWRSENYGVHWMNPVTDQDAKTLFLIDGRHQQNAALVAVDIESGTELWRDPVEWKGDFNGRPFNMAIQRASLLQVDGATLCLGEMGTLLWMNLDREGIEIPIRHQLFLAPQTWTLPAVSGGLLYVMQNEKDHLSGGGACLRCYDLRQQTGTLKASE